MLGAICSIPIGLDGQNGLEPGGSRDNITQWEGYKIGFNQLKKKYKITIGNHKCQMSKVFSEILNLGI